MADGSTKPIDAVNVGDRVMGRGGRANVVTGIDRPILGDRHLYSINGGPYFVTGSQPLFTESGLRSIDPALAALETAHHRFDRLVPGDRLIGHPDSAGEGGLQRKPFVVADIVGRAHDPETKLFSLSVGGDGSYHAGGALALAKVFVTFGA